MVHSVAQFCELVTALPTYQHLVLPARLLVQHESLFEQLLGLPKPKIANPLILFAGFLD